MIYGGTTENGIRIEDMVYAGNDIVHPLDDRHFARFSMALDPKLPEEEAKGKPLVPAVAAFTYADEFKPVYGEYYSEDEPEDKVMKKFKRNFLSRAQTA